MIYLEEAIILATKAHAGQIDKAGVPYIMHPLRVASKMKSEAAMIVAVLHDVVEDTDVTMQDLQKIFDADVLLAVNALTKVKGEPYSDYLMRVAMAPLAIDVKIEDIKDNMDIGRIKYPSQADYERFRKYEDALMYLEFVQKKINVIKATVG